MAWKDNAEEVPTDKKYEAVVTTGQATLKSLLVMNGAATLSFLTFVGTAPNMKAIPPDAGEAFINAIQFFISGSYAAVLAYCAIFITNCFDYWEWHRVVPPLFVLTVICSIASLALFVIACISAISGFDAASSFLFTTASG